MSAVIRLLLSVVWLLLVLLHAPLGRASVAPRQGWPSNLAGGVDLRGACPASIAKKGSTEYHYDVTGALLSVVLPGETVTYEVDGSGRRIRRFDGQTDRRYLYQDGLRIVAELDGTSQVLSRFVWGTRSNVPEYMERGGQRYRFITDQVGSVRLVVNSQTGVVTQRIDYDAWGKVLSDSNQGFQPFGFAGGLYDRDTGLVRFGARDYDPEIGRWTAKDPILFAGGDSNLFLYAGGDPINRIDPSGRIAWAPIALGAMVIAALAIDSSDDTAGHIALIPAALAPLVPAKAWLAAAALSTTQIQSSDDINGMMATGAIAAGSLMPACSMRSASGGGAVRSVYSRGIQPYNGGPRVSLQQAAAAAERKGIDMRLFELEYEAGNVLDFGAVHQRLNVRTAQPYGILRAPNGKIRLTLFDKWLRSELDAVQTISHELNHVRRFLKTGYMSSEASAEAVAEAASQFW